MVKWNPDTYMKFGAERLRPARDLLACVKLDKPELILDLGCGPATSTQLLVERFYPANIIGIDNSPDMIEKAKARCPKAEFICGNVEEWQADAPVDLIFCNALMHWIRDHELLLKRFSNWIKPGGELAFQLPDNLNEPSHLAMTELAGSSRWRKILAPVQNIRQPIATMDHYQNWLSGEFNPIELWRTQYAQVMQGHETLVEWMQGAGLRPHLSLLNEGQRQEFLSDYLTLLRNYYPVQNDGSVIFNFPRLFGVARKI